VALPVMAVLVGGALHLYGSLAARLDARREARSEAWTMRDQPECAREGADIRAMGGGADLPGDVAGKVPGGVEAIFRYGRAGAEVSRTVALPPLAAGEGARRPVRARVVVTCNERDHGGLLEALVGILRHVSGL